MPTITVEDGTQIFYKDWGKGKPVVFSHGWPLTADAWEDQMLFLSERGYRCIAHDRRSHGRSSQTSTGNEMNTYADDLGMLLEKLDIRGAMLVGHSTGGGEVTRYVGRHGSARVSKLVLVGAVPPVMVKSARNPEGLPIGVFDDIRKNVLADRSQFYKDLPVPFYGANREGKKLSDGLRDSFWLQGMMGGLPGQLACIEAFSETDFTDDLAKVDVPTLVIHGDDDQIVPFRTGGLAASKLVRGAKLVVYQGGDHGLPSTQKDRINADLLAFLEG